MPGQPNAARSVRFPDGYGDPGEDRLPWSDIEEKLRAAANYWITTVGPSGRPHARPVDGVWVEGALCFGGSDGARWVRNLAANPAVSVHLPSEAEAIILEGEAERISEPAHPLAEASAAATREKYPHYFQGDNPMLSGFHPFWALRPRRAYAWRLEGFPQRATRWTFAK